MKILLTGGTGFFGRAILRELNSSKWKFCEVPKVYIITRDLNNARNIILDLKIDLEIVLYQADIMDFDTLPKIKFDYIIHAAAEATRSKSLPPLFLYDNIVSGTRNLLDLARSSTSTRFLYVSSGAVYGDISMYQSGVKEGCLTIGDPTLVTSTYGIAKRNSEFLCNLYYKEYGVNFSIARCFAFSGLGLPIDSHYALGNFVKSVQQNEDIKLTSDGTALRTYMDQKDLAAWLLEIMLNGRSGEAYNVGGTDIVTVYDLAKKIKFLSGSSVNILRSKENKSDRRKIDAYVPDVTKAKVELGLDISVNLDESIVQMLR